MNRFALTLNLKKDPELIDQYIAHHQKVWPEIIESIKESGIQQMEIYQVDSRLFMMIEADDTFSFEVKAKNDAANAKVQEWEGSVPGAIAFCET